MKQLDSESSSDSNGNAKEDRVTVEDGAHSNHESDGVTNQNVSIKSDSSTRVVEALLFPC